MSKVLLLVRVEEREQFGQGQALLRYTGAHYISCWLQGESGGFSLPLRSLVIPKAHPKPSPSTAHLESAVL